MSRSLRQLTESQIAKARAEGKLSGLEGEGKPLPHRPVEELRDPGTAVGHRIMAEHGALPQEFDLRKQLDAARAARAKSTDPDEMKRLMTVIADLELRYNIAVEARRRFLR